MNLFISKIASGSKNSLFSLNNLIFFSLFLNSSVGHVTQNNFFDANFQNCFLKIFNLGNPEILKTNFVLN